MIHIPKTGGTALQQVLRPYADHGDFHLMLHHHGFRARDVPRPDFLFFFLRDPVERFVSAFYDRQNEGRPHYQRAWLPSERAAFAVFRTANDCAEALDDDGQARRVAAELLTHGAEHLFPMAHWLTNLDELRRHSDRLLLVGRQESLDRDALRLSERLGLPEIRLPAEAVESHRGRTDTDRRISPRGEANLRRHYAVDYRLLDELARLARPWTSTSAWSR